MKKISYNLWYVSVPARLNTTLAFICISIILTSAWLIISLVLFWSSRLLKKQLAGYTKIFHFGTGLFLGMYFSKK